MIKVNSDKFRRALDTKSKRLRGPIKYTIGFNAPYALIVHENLQAFHANGQAKYLESAIRDLAPMVNGMLVSRLNAGATLEEALDSIAKIILDEAKIRCPVDTGYLRISGYYLVG